MKENDGGREEMSNMWEGRGVLRSASCIVPQIRRRYKEEGYYLLLLLDITWVVGLLRVGAGVPVWHRADLPLLHDLERRGHQSLAIDSEPVIGSGGPCRTPSPPKKLPRAPSLSRQLCCLLAGCCRWS